MEKKLSDEHTFVLGLPNRLRAAWVGVLVALALVAGTASAQPIRITGTVTSPGGAPVAGAVVRALGTDSATTTNQTGRYAITAPANGTLSFTLIGHRPAQEAINGRTTIDVRMERLALLEQVVVTAYSEEQQRGRITGAVASVNLDAAERQTTASVLQRLDAAVSGVRVENSGSPGGRSTIRIRGVSSFQNNDPLYIVDGTPVQETYMNFLNPNDIASIQVLKDASAASIYGSRASNGVVIIETTKRGTGAPRANLRVRTGAATPVRGYDDMLILNSLDYFKVVKTSYENAGQPVPTNIYGDPSNPQVPQFIFPNNCNPNPCQNVDLSTYSYETGDMIMPGSPGTNWWDAVFGTGYVSDYNLDVSGGSSENSYYASFGYFDQKGTAAFNRFNRGSVRVNTSFTRTKVHFGENVALSTERSYGGVGNDDFGEGSILGKNILSQPVVPVYDVAGNFASGKATGLGNNTNPLKAAWAARDNINRWNRVFGNIFGAYDVAAPITLRTQLGFNYGQGGTNGFNYPNPENSEPTFSNSIFENSTRSTDWTWSNTARYGQQFGPHNVSLLLGQEVNRASQRYIEGGMNDLYVIDPNTWYLQDALGNAASKNVNSSGFQSALLSYFGKADYTLLDRYTASFTLRRDGSSNLGPDHRWGTFPAVGLGWRVSQEPFFQNNRFVTDLMLRAGWGVTGNQQIPAGRIVAQFGGDRGDTFYDITGSNSSLVAGFRQIAIGNPNLRWEEQKSINAGLDASVLNGLVDVIFDVYQRDTDNLLFNPILPGTAGQSREPIQNVGAVRNRGFDLSLGHRSPSWSVSLNGSHYKNEIVKIAQDVDFFYGPIGTRFGNVVINQVGHPIGSFFGYVANGYFQTTDEITALNTAAVQACSAAGGTATDCANARYQQGAAPGRIRFRDVNGDGTIDAADRTIVGSPHPDFTLGLDLSFRRGRWDAAATTFGTFGNEIWDMQKEYYVFRQFSTNVRKDRLEGSWSPENPNAKYPRLDENDKYSYQLSSYYVEDGSYVRLRNLQFGYTLPPTWARGLSNARVYLQGENLFTITGYEGLDPALPAMNATGAAGDVRDQFRGVDRGVYPTNRVFSIGITTSF
jgi:TonB-dependent starch-binding outer membrane protein SusC